MAGLTLASTIAIYVGISWAVCIACHMFVDVADEPEFLIGVVGWPVFLLLGALLAAAGLVTAPILGVMWLVNQLRAETSCVGHDRRASDERRE